MQTLAVAVIVIAAAVFAAWRLMPRAWRVRLAGMLATGARRHAGISDHDADALARRLAKGGCGSCDDCGTCAPATPATAHPVHVTVPPRSPAART